MYKSAEDRQRQLALGGTPITEPRRVCPEADFGWLRGHGFSFQSCVEVYFGPNEAADMIADVVVGRGGPHTQCREA